jgi:hypothetical protein
MYGYKKQHNDWMRLRLACKRAQSASKKVSDEFNIEFNETI